MDINRQTGATIRLYREASGMSLSELARRIHRSKSSVSKYESGIVGMDLQTLREISDVLGVSIRDLLFSQDEATHEKSATSTLKIFLTRPDVTGDDVTKQMYLYFYGGEVSDIRESLIELNRKTGETRMLCDPYEKRGGLGFSFMYTGETVYFDSKYRMTLHNHFDDNDIFIMQWADAKSGSETLMGLMSHFAAGQFNSFSTKVLLSDSRLQIDDNLRDLLGLSKDEIRMIRRRNALYGSTRPQEFTLSNKNHR